MKKLLFGIFALIGVLFMSSTPAVSSTAMELKDIGDSVGVMDLVDLPSGGGIGTASLVLVQMWERELLEKFRFEHSWVSRIPSKDQYVNNNIINLQEIGVDPAVLIDNTSYPIATAGRTDNSLPIALNLYETENTKIGYQELTALPYDKEGSVIRQHRETLEEVTAVHGLYNIAPASHTTATPIVSTTGGDNGNTRKRLLSSNIIALKKRFDDYGVPKKGRILVLCSDHISDLLIEDLSFRTRYTNWTEGETPLKLYGFEIFEDHATPVYNDSNVKKAWGAAAAGTDRNASIAFHVSRTVRAKGDVKMFYSAASTDPANRQSVVGFSIYNLILPKKAEAIGAIVSDLYVAP